MKKFAALLLGMSLAMGCVTPTFAGNRNKPKKVKKQKKPSKRRGA